MLIFQQQHCSIAASAAHVLQIPSAKCPAKLVPVPPKQVELAANAPGAAYLLLPALPCLLLAATFKLNLIVSIHGVNCAVVSRFLTLSFVVLCSWQIHLHMQDARHGEAKVQQHCLGTRRRHVLAWSPYASARSCRILLCLMIWILCRRGWRVRSRTTARKVSWFCLIREAGLEL